MQPKTTKTSKIKMVNYKANEGGFGVNAHALNTNFNRNIEDFKVEEDNKSAYGAGLSEVKLKNKLVHSISGQANDQNSFAVDLETSSDENTIYDFRQTTDSGNQKC